MSVLSKTFTKVKSKMPGIPITVVVGILLAAIMLGVAACSGSAAPEVKATWIEPQVAGDIVSIPVNEVKNDKIVHFGVAVALGNEMTFMAYDFDGKLYVRANACVPCRSTEFSLKKDTLVCGTCRTVFKAETGDGVSGVIACKGYPKASVPFETSNGKIVMKGDDLLVAYQNTMEPGLP